MLKNIGLVVLIFYATSIQAVVLHDTTTGQSIGTFLVGNSDTGSGVINQPADSFVVAGGDHRLLSLTLGLTPTSLKSGEPVDYVVRLWDNKGGTPGNLLESLTVDSSNTIRGDTLLNSRLQPLLKNGATYWVSVALPDDLSHGGWSMVDVPSNGRAVALSGAEPLNWIDTDDNGFSMYWRVTGSFAGWEKTGQPPGNPLAIPINSLLMLLMCSAMLAMIALCNLRRK